MSQTESLLLVALGFALALVLAMIFGFAIWSSANRWASYKRKREVPTTILDMQAEREALRAVANGQQRRTFLRGYGASLGCPSIIPPPPPAARQRTN